MKFKEFINGAYNSAAPKIDSEWTMNLYPEMISGDGGSSDSEWCLKRIPGLQPLFLLSDGPSRAMFATQGRLFILAGRSFCEVSYQGPLIGWQVTVRGLLTPAPNPGPAIMRSNSVEICIVADYYGYIFNLNTAVFSTITAPAFPSFAATTLAMIDTYFLTNSRSGSGNQFMISSPLAGLSWAALDFGSTQEPDTIIALAELHLSLWVFGQKRIVIFQNTGAASFPFQRVPGGEIEMGLAAAYSVQALDNTLFWLGANALGQAIVFRADGLLPSRVSNHALEWAMQTYSTVADAVSSTYQEEGHVFYRLDFPSANNGTGATWVYDVSTKRWHQRGIWGGGAYTADVARYHAFYQGMHIVCDYRNGWVYQQSLDYQTLAGIPLRWTRRAPHIVDEGRKRIFYRSFEVLMGVTGVTVGSADMSLSWSDDGGATWPTAHSMAAFNGATNADYSKRIIFRRLGAARSRVFELSGSDALQRLAIAGVNLEFEVGSS